MNGWQIALLIGATIVAYLSARLPRAQLWILAGAASFFFSTAWARYGLPFPPAFTLACDASVCLMIYFFGREKWEIWLYRIFQASVLASLVYLAGPLEFFGRSMIMDHYVYVTVLELLNWTALFVIGGTSVMDWGHEGFAGYRWGAGLFGIVRAWRAHREKAPFHKVPK